MRTDIAKFTFEVPDTHPQAGTKIEQTFKFEVCENDAEALAVLEEKASKSEKAALKWNIVALVNDALKSNARSNAYQAASLPYRPSEVPQEDIVERMVRDYIRMGKTEATARKLVAMALESENE